MQERESPRDGHAEATTAASRASVATPAWNERGIIAENYHDLQGLGVLARGREVAPAPRASAASTARAVYQAIELALLNLADLLTRAAADLVRGDVGHAVVKLRWAHGFHRVLVRLSVLPQQLAFSDGRSMSGCVLRIGDSPGFREYRSALATFDREALAAVSSGAIDLDGVLANASLDVAAFNLLHSARVGNHESTIWEHNLLEIRVPADAPSYQALVAPEVMREAVYDRVLTGDTYFTQFRGLHQIPETLGEEANDHIEQAIRELRAARLAPAIEHLRTTLALGDAILAALPPMADNLATTDYHDIRENLGLTSGSHSVCLRFHLFTDLYRQLWDALRAQLVAGHPGDGEADVLDAIAEAEGRRFEDASSWMKRHLLDQCLSLRALIFQWRDQHLHMPRNNLGGSATKSLTGSPDAIVAVAKMRKAARQSDPLLPLARRRGLAAAHPGEGEGELAAYLASSASLDSAVLASTGRVTQARFEHVQERLGYFSNRCSFVPPPPRQV